MKYIQQLCIHNSINSDYKQVLLARIKIKKTKKDSAYFIVNDNAWPSFKCFVGAIHKFLWGIEGWAHSGSWCNRFFKACQSIDLKKDTNRLTNHQVIKLLN